MPPRCHIQTRADRSRSGIECQIRTQRGMRSRRRRVPSGGDQFQPGMVPGGATHPPGEGWPCKRQRSSSARTMPRACSRVSLGPRDLGEGGTSQPLRSHIQCRAYRLTSGTRPQALTHHDTRSGRKIARSGSQFHPGRIPAGAVQPPVDGLQPRRFGHAAVSLEGSGTRDDRFRRSFATGHHLLDRSALSLPTEWYTGIDSRSSSLQGRAVELCAAVLTSMRSRRR